jgi:hypothetical protein
MRLLACGAADKAVPKGRSLVVVLLLAGLLFEACGLLGVLAAPFVPGWMNPPLTRAHDVASLMVTWRQSVYRREEDPRVGAMAPPLSLQTPTGQRLQWADLKGRRVALLFARDGDACSTRALMGVWDKLQRESPGARVIFAVQKLDPAAPTCVQAGKVRVLLDPGARTARRYNAYWLARAFVLDESGVLRYVQPETTPDPQVPLDVRRLWRG